MNSRLESVTGRRVFVTGNFGLVLKLALKSNVFPESDLEASDQIRFGCDYLSALVAMVKMQASAGDVS